MSELSEALRTVVEEAQRWRAFLLPANLSEEDVKLRSAVDALNALTEPPNEPYGFILNRAWEEVHAGWFVRTPKGDWIEVLGNDEAAGGEKRNVTLAVNGKQAVFTYDASRNVSIRKGTRGRDMDEAIDTLSQAFPGTSVITDWS